MGVIVHKEQDRNTELSRKIAADLKIKAEQAAQSSDPDLVNDSDYLEGSKTTGRYGWIWLVLVGLAILSLILIVIIQSKNNQSSLYSLKTIKTEYNRGQI